MTCPSCGDCLRRRIDFAAAALLVLVGVVAGAVLFGIGGCAAGRTPYGGTVVGFEVGAINPESVSEAAAFGAQFLPAPWGGILTAGASVFGLAGVGAAADARAKRKGERAGWDEAVQAMKNGEPA